MTHEELLTRIDDQEFAYDNLGRALIAVVELHKPLTPRKHMCDCNYCPPFDCEKCESFYPCSTIQVIEKELR